jgi:hypothetical protein
MQSKDQMRIASLAEEDIEKHICVSDDDNDGDKNYCGDDAMDDDDDDDDECQPKANAKAKAKANAATPASASKTTTKAKSSSKGGAVVDAMGRNADVLASAMTSLGSTLGSSIASVGSSIASAAKPEKSVEMARIEMQRELIAANAKEREEERAARRQETEANRHWRRPNKRFTTVRTQRISVLFHNDCALSQRRRFVETLLAEVRCKRRRRDVELHAVLLVEPKNDYDVAQQRRDDDAMSHRRRQYSILGRVPNLSQHRRRHREPPLDGYTHAR